MDAELLAGLALDGLLLAVLISLPVLVATVLASLLTAAGQSVLSVREPGLLLAPRTLLVAGALLASASWMGYELVVFTRSLWALFP